MRLASGRAKGTEHLISLCLLTLLILIAIGLYIKQFHYDHQVFSADFIPATDSVPMAGSIPVNRLPAQACPVTEPPWDRLMPDGFNAAANAQLYRPDNLYEKINGKADIYLSCGFEELFCRRFARQDNPELWMELFVYDMGSSAGAFSVFSQQRRPAATSLSIAPFAYKTDDAVFLSHSNYYVEMSGSALSGELLEAMAAVAGSFVQELPASDDISAILAIFPQRHLAPDSHKLYRTNAFGSEGLTDVFTARYSFDNEPVTAFLSRRADGLEASEAATGYHMFLLENGASEISPVNRAVHYRVYDFYSTIEILFTNGVFVAGIHAASIQPSAEKIALMLDEKLSQIAKK